MRTTLIGCTVALLTLPAIAGEFVDSVEHKYTENDGVKIHYAAAGEGDLVVFIHGWPDFWQSWLHQMETLSGDFRVAALDTRGYNLSDKPEAPEAYDMPNLVGDVAAVIRAEGREKAIIVGHDWGGAIAWNSSFLMPDMVDKLIIVNLPHPACLIREVQTNPKQMQNSAYARNFLKPDSHEKLSAQMLATMVSGGDEEKKARYLEAFERSSLDGMMNYYRRNFPREPYQDASELPTINVPVLQFHGLNDTALLAGGLNDTWNYLSKDYTLVTIPGVGHWSHHEAAPLVSDTMLWWLKARTD